MTAGLCHADPHSDGSLPTKHFASDKPLVAADIGSRVYGPFPTDLAEMEREPGSERKHVVSGTVRLAVPVEILEGGHAGEFHKGAHPSGNAILSLQAIGNGKRVMPDGCVMQQPDSGKGSDRPSYPLPSGITAAKHIPQQIRMVIMVLLHGQRAVLEL